MSQIMLPVGIDSFEKLRTENCYYVDKTGFIEELLRDKFEVNLITRPRRFGKTLSMSMLADFFDIRKDSSGIFEGLRIMERQDLCKAWMNRYPVLFLTLKSVEGLNFNSAYAMLAAVISDLCVSHYYLSESPWINQVDKELFGRLVGKKASEEEVKNSLYTLCRMMRMHYKEQVILLIDEYDAPLANANEYKYYSQMLDVVRSLIGKALKTNEFLKFAVVTGCLRIAKESIFSGTNNFISNSISNEEYSDYFGFTPEEVQKILLDTGYEEQAEKIKKWYDGYRFGGREIYCPWDVLNHIRRLQRTPEAEPENYWKNTSHNGIIRSFIDQMNLTVGDKFERLLSGGVILETVLEDLTYDVLHSTEANFWSILYLTGYLTQADGEGTARSVENGKLFLRIPNEEIKTIFADTIASWFSDTVKNTDRQSLFDAFWNGDVKKAAELVSDMLFDTISYFDYREDYYHGFLTGIFAGTGYAVESNHEYGLGRPDLVVKDKRNRRALIIEVKHSNSENAMKKECRAALEQISAEKYANQFLKGYQNVLCYGVAFFEKECLIEKKE